jgi:hypothetical protein
LRRRKEEMTLRREEEMKRSWNVEVLMQVLAGVDFFLKKNCWSTHNISVIKCYAKIKCEKQKKAMMSNRQASR